MAHMTMGDGRVKEFSPCVKYEGVKSVDVDVNGVIETVFIDPEYGPKLVQIDGKEGGQGHYNRIPVANPAGVHRGHDSSGQMGLRKSWKLYTSTEMEVCVLQAAKINRSRKARFE
mmetsp:Transcript_48272/g.121585  ORF Transcript_48272/g.121585 Transcript_48272/m.121585 type:complete len:115 (+) Transcript_48272:88-432(+)